MKKVVLALAAIVLLAVGAAGAHLLKKKPVIMQDQ